MNRVLEKILGRIVRKAKRMLRSPSTKAKERERIKFLHNRKDLIWCFNEFENLVSISGNTLHDREIYLNGSYEGGQIRRLQIF